MFRVEEFKSQLEHVQHNMASNAEKVDDLHSYTQQLKDLYMRVDHVEVLYIYHQRHRHCVWFYLARTHKTRVQMYNISLPLHTCSVLCSGLCEYGVYTR